MCTLLDVQNKLLKIFPFFSVAERVTRSKHTFNYVNLTVKLHHACIGVIKPDHDHTCPMPGKTVIKRANSKIVAFIKSTSANYKNLKEMIESNHGKMEEIELSKSNVCDIIVYCTLKRNMENFVQKAKFWKGQMQMLCAKFLEGYKFKDIKIIGDEWKEIMEKTALKPSGNGDMDVKVVTASCKVSVVGKKTAIEPMIVHLKHVCVM